MNKKIALCPFCGNEPILNDPPKANIPTVECITEYCEAIGHTFWLPYWNHRVYPPEVQAVLTAAEEYVNLAGVEHERYRKLRDAVRNLKESEVKKDE